MGDKFSKVKRVGVIVCAGIWGILDGAGGGGAATADRS